MSHGNPDNEDEWLDDTIGKGKGDLDLPSGGRWVGVDKAIVERSGDPIADWVTHPSNQWELGDQMADFSDQQEYDPEER